MFEMLNYEFMQNALLAGVLVSVASGIIGTLIVVNRMVFLAGGIAHTSYGGVGIAVYFGIPIFLGASLFSIFAALLMAYITINQKDNLDTFIGLVWATGMALGVLLVDLTPGYNVDLMGYLFGSILAVSIGDLWFMLALVVIIILFVVFWYREILAVSYDSQYALLRGVSTKLFYTLILVFSALTIVVSIKIVGLILVIALLTIPIHIAQKLSNSLYGMIVISIIISTLFTVIGLIISYMYNITSGASIVLVSTFFLAMFLLFFSYKHKKTNSTLP